MHIMVGRLNEWLIQCIGFSGSLSKQLNKQEKWEKKLYKANAQWTWIKSGSSQVMVADRPDSLN